MCTNFQTLARTFFHRHCRRHRRQDNFVDGNCIESQQGRVIKIEIPQVGENVQLGSRNQIKSGEIILVGRDCGK